MNVEEALKDAMGSQVEGVYAPPSMGQAVRRRSRRHVVRFRTAGAALVTAAVAGAVPLYLGGQGPEPPGPSSGAGDSVAVPGQLVPNVVGTSNEEVRAILERAGYEVAWKKVLAEGTAPGTIIAQDPAGGTAAPAGSVVTITMATVKASGTPAPSLSKEPLPQDLGDLGDGRRFGGVHVGYLPDGLVWGKWSTKDGFGDRSYATTWVEPGMESSGAYSVEMVVYRGPAVRDLARRIKEYVDQGATPSKAGGKTVYLVTTEEIPNEGATRAMLWTEGADLGFEVMISPDYGEKLGEAGIRRELHKIAAKVAPTG